MGAIPYTVDVRRDTGVYNGKLGMWLFLASEAMLFGGLFSAYVLLRTASTDWPNPLEVLHVPLATVNTVVLIVSGITVVMAWAALRQQDWSGFQRYLWFTVALGCVFLAIKGFEYYDKLSHGHYPATSIFYGTYFILTGAHVLHLIGGVIALAWHGLFGRRFWEKHPAQFTNRVEVTGLYWHFVDLVWLVLFPTFYLW